MNIQYTPGFRKHFRKLPSRIVDKAALAELRFSHDLNNPSLKTHALKGKMNGIFSFSVGYHYRIIFCYEPDGSVTFIDIGTHRIYR